MQKQPWLPPLLPLVASDDKFGVFEPLALKAATALSRLDGMMAASAKADLFWLGWLLREAQASSEIEGTITTLNELMEENVGLQVALDRKDDVCEVLNYQEALLGGMDQIRNGRKLTTSLIKELHARLLSGVRGENKTPGAFRLIQVQIGQPAVYVPPEAIHFPQLLGNLESFMNREDINPVVQTAILHAQFEMVHPFCDGNGRLGRLMISLFLTQRQLIQFPCFYMSAYLQQNRRSYYDLLNGISSNGDWQSWINFFLKSVIEHCNHNMNILAAMIDLYERSKEQFSNITASTRAIKILDYLFTHPLFTIPDLKKKANIDLQKQALNSLVDKLCNNGIIIKTQEKQGRRPAVWEFSSLVNLIKE